MVQLSGLAITKMGPDSLIVTCGQNQVDVLLFGHNYDFFLLALGA